MSIAIEEPYVMLLAVDMDRAVAFWTDAMGLQRRLVTPYWTELELDSLVVALHGGVDVVDDVAPVFGLRVADVAGTCDAVVAGGGRVIDGPEERPDEGIVLADVADTEGNVFMLSGSLS